MSYGDTLPVVNGQTLPRPSSIDESPEQVGDDLQLANGSSRRYDQGERFVVTLTWGRMTETDYNLLAAAATRGAIPYIHTNGTGYTVFVDGRPSRSPAAGVYPVKFAVSLTLREQTPRTA